MLESHGEKMQQVQEQIEHKQDRNEVLCFSLTADFCDISFLHFPQAGCGRLWQSSFGWAENQRAHSVCSSCWLTPGFGQGEEQPCQEQDGSGAFMHAGTPGCSQQGLVPMALLLGQSSMAGGSAAARPQPLSLQK